MATTDSKKRTGATMDFPSEVADRLGPYYVYVLVDPREESIFYVGKGKGQRALSHLNTRSYRTGDEATGASSAKNECIGAIRAAGQEPRIDVVRSGLSEDAAFCIEAALIDTLPRKQLTNEVRGHVGEGGRKPLADEISRLAAPQLDTQRPLVLIRLRQWTEEPARDLGSDGYGFYFGMSDDELFGNRGWWKVSPRQVARREIGHCVFVYQGVTRGVMTIDGWEKQRRGDVRNAIRGVPIKKGPVFEECVGEFGKRVPPLPQGARTSFYYWPQAMD